MIDTKLLEHNLLQSNLLKDYLHSSELELFKTMLKKISDEMKIEISKIINIEVESLKLAYNFDEYSLRRIFEGIQIVYCGKMHYVLPSIEEYYNQNKTTFS